MFIRWRGADYDEIAFSWDHLNRPKVRLEFYMSRLVFPPADDHPALRMVSGGLMWSWRLPFGLVCPLFGFGLSDLYGPWMTPEAVAARINRRIVALDDYMRRGVGGPLILDSDPRLHGLDVLRGEPQYWDIRGDPWRDPQSDFAGEHEPVTVNRSGDPI
jgi:hypothetical protein